MKQINHKPVSRKRVEQLLDCYGASAGAWPAQERQAALHLLESDPALQQYRNEIADLDRLIAADQSTAESRVNEKSIDALTRKILSALPEQQASRPESQAATRHTRYWFGAIAASLLIASVTTAVLMHNPQVNKPQVSRLAYSEFDQYANWEVFGDEMANDDSELVIFPLIALIEPDLL